MLAMSVRQVAWTIANVWLLHTILTPSCKFFNFAKSCQVELALLIHFILINFTIPSQSLLTFCLPFPSYLPRTAQILCTNVEPWLLAAQSQSADLYQIQVYNKTFKFYDCLPNHLRPQYLMLSRPIWVMLLSFAACQACARSLTGSSWQTGGLGR